MFDDVIKEEQDLIDDKKMRIVKVMSFLIDICKEEYINELMNIEQDLMDAAHFIRTGEV